MQMAGELKQQIRESLDNSDQNCSEEVRLKLYRPKHYSRSPSFQDLLQLKQKCRLIKSFSIDKLKQGSEETVTLIFQTVEDALDFQEQTACFLTYSMALFQTLDEPNLTRIVSLPCEASNIENQINEEGFCIRNGRISLKKQTSIEDLMKNTYNEIIDEQSTIVQTERKISICQEIDKQQQQNDDFQQKEEIKNHNQSYLRSILDGVLVTGAIFGGFKLLKYLIKL